MPILSRHQRLGNSHGMRMQSSVFFDPYIQVARIGNELAVVAVR